MNIKQKFFIKYKKTFTILSLITGIFLHLINCQIPAGDDRDQDKKNNNSAIVENDFTEITDMAEQAETKFSELIAVNNSAEQARTDLAQWLVSQISITEADVADDDNIVYFQHESGLVSGIMTRNSFNNVPAQSAGFSESATKDFIDRPTQSQLPILTSRNVGMNNYLISPFYTENSQHDVSYSLAKYYEIPGFGPTSLLPIIDETANIAMFQAALIGHLPPAIHLTIISHGGRIKLRGASKKTSIIVSGEYATAATWNTHSRDIQAQRIVLVRYKGKNWLCITPEFVEHYSGKPDNTSSHWMARYVHLLTCYGYRDKMLNAFQNNGTVVFSGFTHSVDVEWGNSITLDYFTELAKSKTIQEARSNLSATKDPTSTKCTFEHSATSTTMRYFYRASVNYMGSTFYTPTYGWTAVFDNNPGYYFVSPVYAEDSDEAIGELTIIFDSTSGGAVSAKDSETKIMFETNNATWWTNHSVFKEYSYPGFVNVSTFEDKNGGQVIGDFSGTLLDNFTLPHNTTSLSGKFTLIRSKTD